MARYWKALFKLSISIVALLIAYRNVQMSFLLDVLSSVTLTSALTLTAVYALGQTLSAVKWSYILSAAKVERPFEHIFGAYLFGMYVNNFGLGTVGGDVARAVALKPVYGERAPAFSSVIADRIHGLTVLILVGLCGLFFVRPQALTPIWITLLFATAILMVSGWFFGPQLLVRVFSKQPKLGSLARKISLGFPRQPQVIILITLISACFHLSQIYVNYLIAQELNAPISFVFLLAIVPIVNFASSLPFSLGGIGVREALFVFFFSPLGIDNEVSVAFGAIWLVTATLVSAVGGAVFGFFIPGMSTQALSDSALEDDSEPKEQIARFGT